jgi:hypothetical protein
MFHTIRHEGFSEEVSLLATMMYSMNIAKKPKMKHMTGKTSFHDELVKEFESAFWKHSPEAIREAMSVWEVWHMYECLTAMQGLGGAEPKTLRELIAKKVK